MEPVWRNLLLGELSWWRLLRALIFIYACILIVGCFFSDRLIFPYRQSSYGRDLPGLRFLRASDGAELATRFWKAPEEQFLVLHFHGNAEDLGHLDPIMEELLPRGYSVLGMDYRGYGLSPGTPTEERCYEDAESLYEEALRMGYKPSQIIVWGRSLGSGLAVHLAGRRAIRALVLESPFATAFRAATKWPIVPFDKFDNLKKIAAVEAPLFVLHGGADGIIPPWHSEKLYHRYQGLKERHVVPEAGHNDLWLFPLGDKLDALDGFLRAEAERDET